MRCRVRTERFDHLILKTFGEFFMTIVRDIMAKDVTSVMHDTTLAEAAGILRRSQIADAPVLSNQGDLIGCVSEHALIDVVFDATAKHAPVSQYMNSEVQSIQPEESLSRAAQLFAFHSVERL